MCELLFFLLYIVLPGMHLGYVKPYFTVDGKTSMDLLPSRFIPVGLSASNRRKLAQNESPNEVNIKGSTLLMAIDTFHS